MNTWALNYYDLKGEKRNIAVCSCGNLQISRMIRAARRLAKRKMLDGFIIEAEQDVVDHLQHIIPDLTKIGTDEDGYPKMAAFTLSDECSEAFILPNECEDATKSYEFVEFGSMTEVAGIAKLEKSWRT